MKKNDLPMVAVVEDNLPSLRYMLFLLRRLNVHTIYAETGEAALDMLLPYSAEKKGRIDCMLIDTYLGTGMSGITLMKKLRNHPNFAHIPIIVVTPKFGDDFDDLLDIGFTDFLVKPYSSAQLEKILGKHIPAMKLE